MTFNSLTFIAFFAIVALLHRLPFSWHTKKVNLLIASYVFYAAWNPPFILLLWASTFIDWKVAHWIDRTEDQARRKLVMLLSVVFNLGMLGYFKYGGFLLESFQSLAATVGIDYTPPAWNIVLPIGISFYTFVTMSYTLDVYLRRARPGNSFLDFALFVTYFPHLVAGPILRPTDLLPQFERESRPTRQQLRWGLMLMTLGLFNKIVIADGLLAPVVDKVYGAKDALADARRLARHAGVLGTDLLRLRRLHDDGDRRVAGARHFADRQLPLPVRVDRLLGLLAPLAHLAVHLAARLPVRAAGRQPQGPGPHLRKPSADDAARRPVARRRLDIRRLGRPARTVPGQSSGS